MQNRKVPELPSYMGIQLPGSGEMSNPVFTVSWQDRRSSSGDAERDFELGRKYCYGNGVPQDYVRAAGFLRKAADKGSAGACFYLGAMYCQGEGTAQDYAEGAEWFRRASDLGDALANCNLGFPRRRPQSASCTLSDGE